MGLKAPTYIVYISWQAGGDGKVVIDLDYLFAAPGTVHEGGYVLDFTNLTFWKQTPFNVPFTVNIRAENRAGVVRLDIEGQAPALLCCDRCLREFDYILSLDRSLTLVGEKISEDRLDLYVVPDHKLDLHELIGADLVLEFPLKCLCSPDCLGLCPICGKNLNEGGCSCEPLAPVTDERMKILEDL